MISQGHDELDIFDRDGLPADELPGPTPEFVAQLRMTLRREARRLEQTGAARATTGGVPARRRAPVTKDRPLPPSFRAAHGLMDRVLVACLIAALLVVSVTVLDDRGAPGDLAVIPAGFAGTPTVVPAILGDVPASSGDPARTNAHPGPGLSTIPTVARRAEIAGTAMAQAGNVLVIVASMNVTAVDARTLTPFWSVKLPPNTYGPPAVAGGQIYLTVAGNTEAFSGKAEENQLLALSLVDGHVIWRSDGAGAYPALPIVVGDTVYSLGVADGGYQLGAYRASDGQAIWRSDVGPFGWCCPSIGIALSDRLLAVSLPESASVYDVDSGKQRWSKGATDQENVGPPMIVGDRVIVNQAAPPAGDLSAPNESGSITAFDLRTGAVAWGNDGALEDSASLSASEGGILYARFGDVVDPTGQLTFVSAASGETIWSIPFPRVAADVESYAAPNGAPIVVGETAYAAFTTVPWGGGSGAGSLIAAVDLASGTVRWMARVDGSVMATAIAPNGALIALTLDAGLIALEESGQMASQSGEVVDLRQPATCDAVQADSPLLGPLPATPAIPGVAPWKQPVRFSQIPSGQPSNVDPATAEQIAQRFTAYRSCSLIDPYRRVFGFFSTDFYVRLLTLDESIYNSKEQPWAIWMAPMQEYLTLDKGSLLALPAGRIGGIVNSPNQNIYVWWVQEDGVWKIDEYHRVEADPVDPNAPTPVPSLNPEGTPFG